MRRQVVGTLIAASLLAAPALAGAAPSSTPPGQQMDPVTYAVIGDTPYSQKQIDNFTADIGEINADPDVSRAIHLGDIKSGKTFCDAAAVEPWHADRTFGGDYTSIFNDFALFRMPLVYTPGDNEWTDCHRANNGSYWPAGPIPAGTTLGNTAAPPRLDVIRSMFFAHPGTTLGANPATVDYQSAAYPENVTWNQSRVQFGVVDVPGSNNDWLAWFDPTQGYNSSDDPTPLRTQSQMDEVTNRTAADVQWIDHIFAAARANNAKAVMIGIQADMWDPALANDPNGVSLADGADHFAPIVDALATDSNAWERKVLLVNGDSHKFEVDNPLADPSTAFNQLYGVTQPVPNLERLTVNGSTTPCHEWLKLRVNPRSDSVFSWDREEFASSQETGSGCPMAYPPYPHN